MMRTNAVRAFNAITRNTLPMIKTTGTKRKFSMIKSTTPTNKSQSISNKQQHNNKFSKRRHSTSAAAAVKQKESMTISETNVDPATLTPAAWPKLTHLVNGSDLQTDLVDPSLSFHPLIDNLINSAPHSVITTVGIENTRFETVGVIIASADQGILIDLSESISSPIPQFLFDLLRQLPAPPATSQHKHSKPVKPIPLPSRYESTMKLIPNSKQKRRLRKLLQNNNRDGKAAELHPSVICLTDRLQVLKPIIGKLNICFLEEDTGFSLSSPSHLHDHVRSKALIQRAQSMVNEYIKIGNTQSKLHSFLVDEIARLPQFQFNLTPILPPLGPITRDIMINTERNYSRFVLSNSTSTLPLLKLLTHSVRMVSTSNTRELEAAIREFKASCTDSRVIGFDTESRANFRANSPNNPVSLIQFASSSQVLLIRVDRNLKRLPKSVEDLLLDPSFSKVGQGLDGDVNLLCNQYQLSASAQTDPSSHSFLDMAYVSSQLRFATPGLASMVAGLLGYRLSKAQQCSNWELKTLTSAQIEYASLDAIVSKQIYHRLEELMHSFNDIMLRCADAHNLPRTQIQPWLIEPIWCKTVDKKKSTPAKKKLPSSDNQ